MSGEGVVTNTDWAPTSQVHAVNHFIESSQQTKDAGILSLFCRWENDTLVGEVYPE